MNNGGNINTTNNAVVDQVKQGRTRIWQNVSITAPTILLHIQKNINQSAFSPNPIFWGDVWFWLQYLSNRPSTNASIEL